MVGDRSGRDGQPPAWVMPDLSDRLDALWELAAVACAWGGQPGAPLTERSITVARLSGFDLSGPTESQRTSVLAEVRSQLRLAASLAEGDSVPGWNPPDDATLQAQGVASRRIATIITEDLAARFPELGRQLAEPGAHFLDVGVGVAQISLGLCQTYSQLRATGIDVNPRPLKLAADNVAAASLSNRIELRLQSFADLADSGAYSFAWVPLPFLPEDVAAIGLGALRTGLRASGWLLVACHEPDTDERAAAMTWLQATIVGGNRLTSTDTTNLLTDLGYDDFQHPPSPSGAPQFVLARNPRR